MPEEHTTQIKHGQLSSEEIIHQQLKHFAESHLKKDLAIFSKEDSQLLLISLFFGHSTWTSTCSWRTSSSWCGHTMISAMTGVNYASIVLPSLSHQWLLTQLIIQGKWLIFGQKKEVVSAHGTTATDNALNGWLQTWICNFIISLKAIQVGWRDLVSNIS